MLAYFKICFLFAKYFQKKFGVTLFICTFAPPYKKKQGKKI